MGQAPTQNEAEVDVEQAAVGAQHEVVQVTVAHPQDVRHHTVPRAALHKRVQRRLLEFPRPCTPAHQTATVHPGAPSLPLLAVDIVQCKSVLSGWSGGQF